jgi:hypothetical protein
VKTLQLWLKDKGNQTYSLGQLSQLEVLYLNENQIIINKKHKQLIEFLDKHNIKYTCAYDTLLTDLLL